MPNTNPHMTHADIYAARDGALYVVQLRGTAKLVRDGKTLARLMSYTDGTFATCEHGGRAEPIASWELGIAWLSGITQALAVKSTGVYLVTFDVAPVAA